MRKRIFVFLALVFFFQSPILASSNVFTYTDSKPLHAPKGNFKYDANGNLTTTGIGYTYVYDQANRLIKVTDKDKVLQENTYDHTGARIRKVDYTPQGTIQKLTYSDDPMPGIMIPVLASLLPQTKPKALHQTVQGKAQTGIFMLAAIPS